MGGMESIKPRLKLRGYIVSILSLISVGGEFYDSFEQPI